MRSSAYHRIFGIPELYEEILLLVDLPTLLTSAQRVCRMWHRVIQDSGALQRALFFKASEKRVEPEEKRINPFVQSDLWRGLFRREVYKRSRVHMSRKWEAYLRREANWRRMLLKQPPSNKVTVVGSLYLDTQSLTPLQLALKPHSDWCRLGDLYSGIEQEIIFPMRDPFVFLCVVHPHSELDPKLRPSWSTRTVPISKLLFDCDAVFFHRGTPFTVSPRVDFEDWLWSLDKFDLEPTLGGDFDDNWCFGFPGLRKSVSEYLDKV
ncbi:uncharacterized protein P174DRAFT_430018 [Aspergillus novofumigatus IBT 16806]|uniref:F-box domain-containing protein n=1 Tax=Aspergillus novofumigatus (strain IBT 16806) TaxID=1392255 RepID=A0A2I1CDH9_ASPN1|nr:uncharacterized protein P174DRAFT_430018 [Aspergillus novofumigatus IBT 16806]PKX95669.1 hypothetical protein P174DRAFT_430018 [Aspergillus novofumigatus IBT 16806]